MTKSKCSRRFAKLSSQLPDIEKHITNHDINVVPLPVNEKAPKIPKWQERTYSLTDSLTYENSKGKKITQASLKKHKGNYGIIIGYNNSKNGYSIACIDIDGYTLETEDKDKQAEIKSKTQKLIYEALKDLPNTLQVKTQSGGYHIYCWTKQTEPKHHKTSKSLYFPEDFQIKELAGKCLEESIEIFTEENRRQTVLPSSKIKDKETGETRNYTVISDLNKFADMEIAEDINQTVIDHLTKKQYTYKEDTKTSQCKSYKQWEEQLFEDLENRPKKKAPTKKKEKKLKKCKSSTENELLRLKDSEIEELVQILCPIYKKLDGIKHTATLYLGGYFSYHITKHSARRIANGINKEIGDIFEDSSEFKKTILKNYEPTHEREKGGLPKLCELIHKKDPDYNITEFADKLQSICNNSFTKKEVGEITINDTQVPIFVYEDEKSKWLNYKGILEGTDLILNLNTYFAEFKTSETESVIDYFQFELKYGKYFELSGKKQEEIKENLILENLQLPKDFFKDIGKSIINLDDEVRSPKQHSRTEDLKILLHKRKKENYARKELGNYLYEHGTVLRRGVNTPYILNPDTKGYDSVETDDIIDFLYATGDFILNTIHSEDITKALGYISERIKPSYDIVKFTNCLYDIKNFRIIEEPKNPILTLTEVQYAYNPEAKGELIVDFLKTSLKQKDDTPKELEERIIGVYEMIGYLLTSGNKRSAWFIITGIGGAGKGVFTRLIISLFGSDKVGDLKLQELTPDNKFATAHLLNKIINIVRDSPKKPIEDTGMLKSITGYDDIGIEPKGKDKYILPKEEVPDMITVCNNIPKFREGFDESILQRAIIFEFLTKFRNTEKQNPNLEEDILSNPQEMEYLIYQSVQAYKDMIENNRDFKARITEEKTMELLSKHTDPIGYILPLLLKNNPYAEGDGEDVIRTNELNKLILFVSKELGLNITELDKDGKINSKTLIAKIRHEFNFDKEYSTKYYKSKYENGRFNKTERIYPDLCKTPEYDVYLKEMLETEEE